MNEPAIANTLKDTENVSKQLKEDSGGAIKTGVYHSEVQDRAKEELHKDWRTGKIQVVCATIGTWSACFTTETQANT